MNTQQKPYVHFIHEGFNVYVYDCGPNVYFYVEDEMIGHFKGQIYRIGSDFINEQNLNLSVFNDKERVLLYFRFKFDLISGLGYFPFENLDSMYGLETSIALKKAIYQEIGKAVEEQGYDFEYEDNHRIAEVGVEEEEKIYNDQLRRGCCGFFDTEIEVNGRKFWFGFNYGH